MLSKKPIARSLDLRYKGYFLLFLGYQLSNSNCLDYLVRSYYVTASWAYLSQSLILIPTQLTFNPPMAKGGGGGGEGGSNRFFKFFSKTERDFCKLNF